MARTPMTLRGTASVQEAACVLRDAAMGDVIVSEHQQGCGMMTDRDILIRTVTAAQVQKAAIWWKFEKGDDDTSIIIAPSPQWHSVCAVNMPHCLSSSTYLMGERSFSCVP
jgi:hypothetical protein